MAALKPVVASAIAIAALSACASGDVAPVEYRGGSGGERPVDQDAAINEAPAQMVEAPALERPPPRREPAPVERRGASSPMLAAGAPETEPPKITPPPASAEPPPSEVWQARPGPSLADFALKPEDARPFDWRSPPTRHTVEAGDTVFKLSALYQTPVRALIEANSLAAPFALSPGQELTLPPPRRHTLAAGETLLSVARTYSVDVRSLALLNRLQRPYTVHVGDSLVLPMDARPRTPIEPAPVAAAPTPSSPAQRTVSAAGFLWPVRGEVLARFGPAAGGRRIDGIDIAAPEGASISAAAAGTVVYAGADLPGYGHLALVQHPGGWVTAYARARSLTVREGDRVRRGETIGHVGRIGQGPTRLHFQVRQGRTPRDPLTVLPQD